MFRPFIGKNTLRKKTRDAVIQAMIEVDVEEREDFLVTWFLQCFCNVLIITGCNKKQVVIS